ncbi:MAG: permease-like cell division protein FtsX [Lachnospirales bacterium]
MKIRSIRVCLKQGLQGIWRNRLMVLASVCTVSACLFILGIVYCLVANVQQFADDLDDSLGIIAFLSENVSEESVPALVEQIRGMEGVKDVTYVSADEAWQSFKESMGFDDQLGEDTIAQLDQDNPLANSASLEIYLYEAADQNDFVAQLQTMPQIRSIRYAAETADVLANLSSMITWGGMALILLLVFIAILLISNTIKLSVFVRRTEIGIMKYIGAKDSFVKIPFVVEGMIIGVLGAVLPAILIYFSYGSIVNIVMQQFSTFTQLIHFISANTILIQLIPIFLAVGIVVGVLGSTLSLRKYLKV